MSDQQDLIEAFRRLGVEAPESWARSETKEGIPQLARLSLLYWMWRGVVGRHHPKWVDRELRRASEMRRGRDEPVEVMSPHAPVLRKMLKAGISREEITDLVRQMQIDLLAHCCVIFDGISNPPKELGVRRFGVFELDDEERPVRRVPGLHESVFDFDRELRERRAGHRGRSARS